MSIFDKAKEFAKNNPDKVDQGVEKAGDAFDSKTDNKYADKTDKAQEALRNKLGE